MKNTAIALAAVAATIVAAWPGDADARGRRSSGGTNVTIRSTNTGTSGSPQQYAPVEQSYSRPAAQALTPEEKAELEKAQAERRALDAERQQQFRDRMQKRAEDFHRNNAEAEARSNANEKNRMNELAAAIAKAEGKSTSTSVLTSGGAPERAATGTPIYKLVDKNGKVTFTDRVPNDPSVRVVSGLAASDLVTGTAPTAAAAASTGDGLPGSLTAIVQRFPVVLYTGNACNPCNSARTFLQKRGIPFTEKTIRTNADIDALQRIAGDNSLPLITVGQQQLKGFSENDLNGYLEAASYPKSINLPSGYRNGAASPLVAVNLREGTVTDPGVAPAAPPPPPASNAAGIRF